MNPLSITLTAVGLCLFSQTAKTASVVGVGCDTGFYEIDNVDGTILSGGLPTVDHDGTVVQFGYYDVVRGWTPLTGEGSANTAIAKHNRRPRRRPNGGRNVYRRLAVYGGKPDNRTQPPISRHSASTSILQRHHAPSLNPFPGGFQPALVVGNPGARGWYYS